MKVVSELTQMDGPTRLTAHDAQPELDEPTLAVVRAGRSSTDLVRELFAGPFAGLLREHGLEPVFCAADDSVIRQTHVRGVLLVGDSPDDVIPSLVRLRANPATILLPIIVAVRGASPLPHHLTSPIWRSYADAVLEGESVWQPAAAMARLREIDTRYWQLQPLGDRFPESGRRQVLLLRWLVTRDQPAFEALGDPSAPSAWSWPPFDLAGDIQDELDALARLGMLKRAAVERVCLCPGCDDARLLFREVCASCRSADVRRGDVVHHYACGHVQSESFFRQGRALVCPSCKEELRQVGVDYERPASLLFCNSCSQAAAEGTTEARCLGCGATPLANEVRERAVYRYALTAEGAEAAQLAHLPTEIPSEAE